MTERPDSPAVLGLLVLAALLGVGAIVLLALDKDVPPELWAIVAASAGAVGGWVGKTLTKEKPPPPEPIAIVEADTVQSDALTRTGQ